MGERFFFGRGGAGEDIHAIRLGDGRGMEAVFLEYGAAVQRLIVPARAGSIDAALGYDTLAAYEAGDAYFGAAVGRFGNRIGGAAFPLCGRTVHVTANERGNCLHGGARGMSRVKWEGALEGEEAVFRRSSPDGEEGFPGALEAEVRYALADGALRIRYTASVTAPCPVSLTNHTYFNLAGGGDILGHLLFIGADAYAAVDAALIPAGRPVPVAGGPFDFRAAKPIGRDIAADDRQLRIGQGYDHNFCLSGEGLRPVARLTCPASGVAMQVVTDRPGLQFYAGGCIAPQQGKGGAHYGRFSGLALETQLWPDAPNRPDFQSSILLPGEVFRSETRYEFSLL